MQLEILAPQLPGIRELDIGRCHKITGETLRYVAAAMPSLADLNLVGCQGITAAGLHHLVKLPELQASHSVFKISIVKGDLKWKT